MGRIRPEDWDLFQHEYVCTLKGYDVYKVCNSYFIQVASKEWFGYRNLKKVKQALEVLPNKDKSKSN